MHSGERGPTLIEKMEQMLDATLSRRVELQQAYDMTDPVLDEEGDDKAYEALVENRGEIRGMLKMLGIMRSTSGKVELTRAKARLAHAPHED